MLSSIMPKVNVGPTGIAKDFGLSPYEKILNRYYGGLDVAISPGQIDRVDAFIVSYPKSGRTWVKIFLQVLMIRHYGNVHFDGNIFGAGDSPRILPTHTSFYYRNNKKTLFILRDPRDILVSFYHHVQNRGPATMHKYKTMSIGDFVRDDDLGIKAIVNYYKRWWKRFKKCRELMVVRYEDLISNDTEIFNDILHFMGFQVPFSIMLKTVEFCRFENLKKEISKKDSIFAQHPEKSDLMPASKNPNSAKMRRGIVGGYTDELSKDDVLFCNRHIKKIPKTWRFYG